jgi:hypothetical protein
VSKCVDYSQLLSAADVVVLARWTLYAWAAEEWAACQHWLHWTPHTVLILPLLLLLLQIDLVCLGSRGMGSFKRSLMGFVGLGSVSDYCVHNLGCAVAVIKAEADQLPAAAASGAAQAADAVAAEVAAAAIAAKGATAGASEAAAAAAAKED